MHSNNQTVYLNGNYLPMVDASISPQDRGFLFGDGVYEVIPIYKRNIFEFSSHLKRLKNSLTSTSIPNPMTDSAWLELCNELVKLHPWDEQFIYIQVTRGVQMQRDHLPSLEIVPTVYAYSNELKPCSPSLLEQGLKVITLDDIRWLRCDIKAITLLPNVMMKLASKQAGVDDAIMISRDGLVSEGSSSNVFVVKDDTIMTPKSGNKLLSGITRQVIASIIKKHNLKFKETDISLEELQHADEIWMTSSTKECLAVTQLNGIKVGNGKPGKFWNKIQIYYQDFKTDFINNISNA